tara:strand:+ start:2068 stop:2646 length:579 start_codon:yes stop_codon:yes gene_type:complete
MLNLLKDNVDKNNYWCILNQTFENNEWFRYGAVEEGSKKNYNSFISHLNLNYKLNNDLNESIKYISDTISNINKKVVLLGTSQGATTAFHYFHSNVCSEKVMGIWLHNMAGFYPEYLDISKKYSYNNYIDVKMGDRHAVFDDDTFGHMNRSLNIIKKNRSKHVFFYNSKNDNVVPGIFKNIMMSELFRIYNL